MPISISTISARLQFSKKKKKKSVSVIDAAQRMLET